MPVKKEEVVHLCDILSAQIAFSSRAFGPGPRTKGLLDHIRKELKEVEAEPFDLEEWVDIMILAADGAWRSGHDSDEVESMYLEKLRRNMERQWPDWRTSDPDKAIEHIR